MKIKVESLPNRNRRSKKLEKKPIVTESDDEELIRIHTTHDDGCQSIDFRPFFYYNTKVTF